MTGEFLPADATSAKQEIVAELYQRLHDVRRSLAIKVPQYDEFEIGISCRLANEEAWLVEFLDKIERS